MAGSNLERTIPTPDDEYSAEVARLKALLNRIGIDVASLSPELNASLECLASIAETLHLENTSSSCYKAALADLKVQEITSEESNLQLEFCHKTILNASNALSSRLSSLDEEIHVLEASSTLSQAKRNKMQNNLQFVKAKAVEYNNTCKANQEELEQRGFSPSISHEELMAESNRLEQLQNKLLEVKRKLKTYADLPPDVVLAREKLEDQRKYLVELEKQLADTINDRTHVF